MREEGFRNHVATDDFFLGIPDNWRSCEWVVVQLDYDWDLFLYNIFKVSWILDWRCKELEQWNLGPLCAYPKNYRTHHCACEQQRQHFPFGKSSEKDEKQYIGLNTDLEQLNRRRNGTWEYVANVDVTALHDIPSMEPLRLSMPDRTKWCKEALHNPDRHEKPWAITKLHTTQWVHGAEKKSMLRVELVVQCIPSKVRPRMGRSHIAQLKLRTGCARRRKVGLRECAENPRTEERFAKERRGFTGFSEGTFG